MVFNGRGKCIQMNNEYSKLKPVILLSLILYINPYQAHTIILTMEEMFISAFSGLSVCVLKRPFRTKSDKIWLNNS